ncbi:hypothetical protein ADLP1_094 [Acinetobacter phage vB_AbaM_DLP1]|nr:hypothetical protein ADLP1_094 [Acinetobacter phage vB_AbaM_DLP1]
MRLQCIALYNFILSEGTYLVPLFLSKNIYFAF